MLFLIFIHDLPSWIASRCFMLFADDVKLICSTNEVNTLLGDRRQTFLWTLVWDMRLNIAKSQQLHLCLWPIPTHVMLDETGDLLQVLLAQQTTNLRAKANSVSSVKKQTYSLYPVNPPPV